MSKGLRIREMDGDSKRQARKALASEHMNPLGQTPLMHTRGEDRVLYLLFHHFFTQCNTKPQCGGGGGGLAFHNNYKCILKKTYIIYIYNVHHIKQL